MKKGNKLTLLTGKIKMCSKTQGYYQTTEEIKMSVIAIHENGIKLKDVRKGNYYILFYDDGSINFKLNTEGMLIEDNINDMTSHEIDMIQWSRDIIRTEEPTVIF